jgi:ferric enterobactin receptor
VRSDCHPANLQTTPPLRYFLWLCLLLSGPALFAQIPGKSGGDCRIIGKVVDSASKAALAFATISLNDAVSGKAVTGTTTNNNGTFRLTGIPTGHYRLLVEFIGYRPKRSADIDLLSPSATIDLNTIYLSSSTTDLQGITIKGRKSTVENKIDRIVFNAERDITSQGGVATDILKKVPQVSVGVDGTVELLGSSAIHFLINGKPSTIFGSNITDVLQSIPASQIKSIEVITNPGAKYDAQGLGGIINIILKQNSARGINGNLSLTAGTRAENGSFNLNVRNGDFGMNAYVNGNVRLKAATPTHTEKLSRDTLHQTDVSLLQDGSSAFSRDGFSTGLGFDWTYKKKNAFYGSLSYFEFGNAGNGHSDQTQVISDAGNPGEILSTYSGVNRFNSNFHSRNLDMNLNYKRTFERKDKELEIGLDNSHGNRHNSSYSNQYLLPQDSLYFGTDSGNPGTEDQTEVHLDFSQPFPHDVMTGFGGKVTLNDIHSNSEVKLFDPATGVFAPDSILSNTLEYRQKVFALYAEAGFPIGKLFQSKVGVRYERTDIQTRFSNAQQQAQIPGYNTFVPSIYLSRKLNDRQTLKLSYSRRIERPGYGELNPFINTSDPKNISTGNPYLSPELGDRFEFSYNLGLGKTGSIMATLFHRINHDDIQPFIVYHPELQVGDTIYRNVFVTTPQNIGIEKNTGLNLFLEINANDKLSFRSNSMLFYRHTINKQDPGYNSNSVNYRFNLNGTYQFKHDLTAEFFGSFNSARHEAQGKYPSFTNYSMALRKQFWAKKGSLALSLINPFGEYVKQTTELFGPNFTSYSTRHIPFRAVSLNFTWKFGKLEFKKEKEDRNEGEGQVQ